MKNPVVFSILVGFLIFGVESKNQSEDLDFTDHSVGSPIINRSSYFKQDFRLGYKLKLFCEATGSPRPEIVWYHRGVEVNPDHNRTVRNQSRFVYSVKRMKTGPKPVSDPTKFAELSALNKYTSYQNWTDQHGKFHYIYTQCFPKNLKFYLSQCPKKQDLDEHKYHVDRLIGIDKKHARENIKSWMSQSDNGYRFASGTYVDTTFCMCDGYVTLVVGQIPNFRTAKSKKHRHLLLAFMISSDKKEMCHDLFSSKLRDAVIDLKIDAAVPFTLTDSESALRKYATIRFSIHGSTISSYLDIDPTSIGDKGEYECVASNAKGSRVKKFLTDYQY